MAALLIGRIALQQLEKPSADQSQQAQRRPSLRSRRKSCSNSSSTRTGNIPAPISIRRASAWRRRRSPRSATSLAKLLAGPEPARCWRSAPAGAAWPCIWRNRARRRRHRHHAQRRAAEDLPRTSETSAVSPTASASSCRTTVTMTGRQVRPHRLRRHVRACRHRQLRQVLQEGARRCWPMTASWSCIPSPA